MNESTHVAAVAVAPATFTTVADARVDSAAPTSNYGSSLYLHVESTTTSTVYSYVKFNVAGLTGQVRSARLRMYISDGTDDGPRIYSAGNAWDESTITWNNKPAHGAVVGDNPLKVPSGGYVEWDVTSLVSADGTYTFAFVPDSADRMTGRSKNDPNPPQLVIHTAPAEAVFTVAADARVNSEYPTVEYGTQNYLWVRPLDTTNAWPDVRTYLRFNVSGVSGPITNARVRLYNYEWASDGPEIYHVPDNSWDEALINWSNKPARATTVLDDKGPVPSGTYYEWDVSNVVTANGTYSFVLEGDPTSNSMRSWAKEYGSLQPQLVVLAGGTATQPPSPTGARWPIKNSTAPDADQLGDAYGPRLNAGVHDFHAGIDIPAPIGTPVYAVLGGTVHSVTSTWDDATNPCCSGGRRVVINHGGTPTRFSTYLHLSETLVTEGATVAAGQQIAKTGISGARHAHLHFTYSEGVASEAYSKNPLELLPHTSPVAPVVSFGSSLVSIQLPVQQMTVRKIKLEGGGQSRTVDYYSIVALGNPARDGQVQGDGMYMEVPANPSGSPLTFTLNVRPDPATAFVPDKITIEAFDGRSWEFYRSASSSSSLSSIITAPQFETMFPSTIRDAKWTYDGFITAANKFPAFGNTGDLTKRKREVAAFLANVAHETGRLRISTEQYPPAEGYCDTSWGVPCPLGASAYIGRGPLQLSWNFNYKAAGDYLGPDLLNNPTWVASVPSIGWESSLWFWMLSLGASYGTAYEMTAHDAMTLGTTPTGFTATIHTINGELECNKTAGSTGAEQRASRLEYYETFVGILGTDMGYMNPSVCP